MGDGCAVSGDVVFEDIEMENTLLYQSPKQKWYYISDQLPSEAWIFVQGDNRVGKENLGTFTSSLYTVVAET